MEEIVKQLIVESLQKRLVGHEDIDDFRSNEVLIERWLDAIMALGNNDCNVEAAIAEMERTDIDDGLLVPVSIEDARALAFLTNNRFPDEISAFQKYVELKDRESDEAILYAVKEELQYVEEGDFMLS